MLPKPAIPIPAHLEKNYQILRAVLYIGVIIFVTVLALKAIFPEQRFSFDFRNPGASKNSLLEPHTASGENLGSGKLSAGSELIAYASSTGDFSHAVATLVLEEDSETPENLLLTLRRSYRDFWLPEGEAITSFPSESLYRVRDTYYALREGTLHPFVSERAFLTRYRADQAVSEDEAFLSRYPVSEDWLGFRVGTFVAYADGVFLIESDQAIRPVVSAETFLAMGYRFEDVIPASAEEVGIYAKGKLFLLGMPHPDGTLFFDEDTATTYTIANGVKRKIAAEDYRTFLAAQQAPIRVSKAASEETVTCGFQPRFGGRLSCETPIGALTPGYGNDFEVRLSGADTDAEFRSATVSFVTEKSMKNVLLFGSKIKERLLLRFGYATP